MDAPHSASLAGPESGRGIESRSIDYIPGTSGTQSCAARGRSGFWEISTSSRSRSASSGRAWACRRRGPRLPARWASCSVFMAFHGSQGPEMGLPQMIQSRAQFGYRGVALAGGHAVRIRRLQCGQRLAHHGRPESGLRTGSRRRGDRRRRRGRPAGDLRARPDAPRIQVGADGHACAGDRRAGPGRRPRPRRRIPDSAGWRS